MQASTSITSYTIESLKSTDAEPKDFDFFRFEYFAKDIEHLKVPHRHHFYTFILVTAGSGNHAIDFENYELKTRRLFMIAPGQVHSWIALKKVKGFIMLFNDAFMALAYGRKMMAAWPLFKINRPNYIDLSQTEASVWEALLLYIEHETKQQDEFTRDALFYSISSLLVRASRLTRNVLKTDKTKKDILFDFQELINQNFRALKIPKEYATRLNVTPNYLNAICKKQSGRSAGSLIRQRILLEAKRLLAHTQLPISEVSFQLGFEDNSYFGRFFKKYAGQTPARFRYLQS